MRQVLQLLCVSVEIKMINLLNNQCSKQRICPFVFTIWTKFYPTKPKFVDNLAFLTKNLTETFSSVLGFEAASIANCYHDKSILASMLLTTSANLCFELKDRMSNITTQFLPPERRWSKFRFICAKFQRNMKLNKFVTIAENWTTRWILRLEIFETQTESLITEWFQTGHQNSYINID